MEESTSVWWNRLLLKVLLDPKYKKWIGFLIRHSIFFVLRSKICLDKSNLIRKPPQIGDLLSSIVILS